MDPRLFMEVIGMVATHMADECIFLLGCNACPLLWRSETPRFNYSSQLLDAWVGILGDLAEEEENDRLDELFTYFLGPRRTSLHPFLNVFLRRPGIWDRMVRD